MPSPCGEGKKFCAEQRKASGSGCCRTLAFDMRAVTFPVGGSDELLIKQHQKEHRQPSARKKREPNRIRKNFCKISYVSCHQRKSKRRQRHEQCKPHHRPKAAEPKQRPQHFLRRLQLAGRRLFLLVLVEIFQLRPLDGDPQLTLQLRKGGRVVHRYAPLRFPKEAAAVSVEHAGIDVAHLLASSQQLRPAEQCQPQLAAIRLPTVDTVCRVLMQADDIVLKIRCEHSMVNAAQRLLFVKVRVCPAVAVRMQTPFDRIAHPFQQLRRALRLRTRRVFRL